jgi:hypothetical protein
MQNTYQHICAISVEPEGKLRLSYLDTEYLGFRKESNTYQKYHAKPINTFTELASFVSVERTGAYSLYKTGIFFRK